MPNDPKIQKAAGLFGEQPWLQSDQDDFPPVTPIRPGAARSLTQIDLNRIELPTGYVLDADEADDLALPDGGRAFGEQLQVVTRGQIRHLSAFIGAYPDILGCVAWLTHEAVIGALATRNSVSLILQKEDYLRAINNDFRSDFTRRLRASFARLRFPYTLGQIARAGALTDNHHQDDAVVDPVRCFGIGRTQERRPVLHHKFLVGGEWANTAVDGRRIFVPAAVWTGSFNPTINGDRSLDNSVILRARQVAQVYRDEWWEILKRSEPLNWENDEPSPQWTWHA